MGGQNVASYDITSSPRNTTKTNDVNITPIIQPVIHNEKKVHGPIPAKQGILSKQPPEAQALSLASNELTKVANM